MAESLPQTYVGLARRFRPQQFSEMVGQDQIAQSMAQQILQDQVAQSYLFSGPRGVGKTSAARILAKSVNCQEGPTPHPCGQCDQCRSITAGNNLDVIEIDGASNRGIEDIRSLQETINQNPFAARKKIYIIDEVHMLTREAFNALLKTLEEPPSFVIFIFATTEVEKIPDTIKSRCQLFQFHRFSLEDLIRRLDQVAEAAAIAIQPEERSAIFETIALAVDGGMRDALMALDQLRALSEGEIRLDTTVRFLGVVEHDLLIRTVELLIAHDTRALLELVNLLVERGRDLERFVRNLLSFLRDLMILKSGGADLCNLSSDKLARAEALLWKTDAPGNRAEAVGYATLLNMMQVFLGLEEQIKESVQVRIHLEFAFVKLTAIEPVVDIAHLLERAESRSAAPRPVAPARPAASKPSPQPEPAPPRPRTPLKDPKAVWDTLVQSRDKLGLALSLALKECRYIDGNSERIKVGISSRSMALNTLRSSDKSAALETALTEIAGNEMRLQIVTLSEPPASAGGSSEESGGRAASSSPSSTPSLFREAHDPESDAGDMNMNAEAMDIQALFLAQDPDSRVRQLLKDDGNLRDKVEMIRRFFDGRLLDTSGREISL